MPDSPPKSQPLSRSIVAGLTAVFDVMALLGSAFAIYLIYIPAADRPFAIYSSAALILTLLSVLAFSRSGLYKFKKIIYPASHVSRVAGVLSVVFLGVIALAFTLKISEMYSRGWTLLWFGSSILLVCGERFVVAALLRRFARTGRLTRNVMIYGGSDQGQRLLQYLESLNEPWNNIVGIYDERLSRSGAAIGGVPVVGDLADLLEFGRKNRSDEIIIALPWTARNRILEVIRTLLPLPANIRLSPETLGNDLLHRRISRRFGVAMLSIAEKPVSGWGAVSKSLVDFTLGTIFLLLTLPLMLIVAICIKLESRGPVLFKQKRFGFNNDLLEIYKFRTMYDDQTDQEAKTLTARDDPRVTKIGKILRRYSLDELPQLFNVLKGEMSLVGPRPHAPQASAEGRLYADVVNDYAVRHKVKPGITGWAQVCGWRGNTETEEDIIGRVDCDLYYIENWSVLFDLYILLRTTAAVFSGKNSF